jgi:hypothetical protein
MQKFRTGIPVKISTSKLNQYTKIFIVARRFGGVMVCPTGGWYSPHPSKIVAKTIQRFINSADASLIKRSIRATQWWEDLICKNP